MAIDRVWGSQHQVSSSEGYDHGSRQLPGFHSMYFGAKKRRLAPHPRSEVSKCLDKKNALQDAQHKAGFGVYIGGGVVHFYRKDAYFHVPICPDHRPFLRFAFQGQAYQFKVLLSGLSLSPRVFIRVVATAFSPLQLSGMKIFLYLDDWLSYAASRSQFE